MLTILAAPADGAMAGLAAVIDAAGIAIGEIEAIVHGTTLATNALIERRGARTALVTTASRRDRDAHREPVRAGRPEHVIEIAPAEGHELTFSAMADRLDHPALGREGGGDGAAGALRLDDGTKMRPKGWQHVPAGRRLVLEAPGGAGCGDPQERPDEAVRADPDGGYVTPAGVSGRYRRDPGSL